MEETKKDLNAQETGAEKSTAEETASKVKEDLKNTEETPEQKTARLLKDGTPSSKSITIPKEKYDELRAVEEFTKTHAPLIEKVRSNPDLLKKVMGEGEPKQTRDEEIATFLEERKAQKRKELSEAVNEALTREKAGEWPDFEKDWGEIKPIADSLKNIPYREALRKAYIAVHPEIAQAEAEREAKRQVNREGTFSSFGGQSPDVNKILGKSAGSEAERIAAKRLGYKSVEDYLEITSKYETYAKEHGWWNPT